MKYTMAELDQAMRWAFDFNDKVVENVKASSGRVVLHRMACERCFMDNLSGPNVDILRDAMLDLKPKGMYQPVDGVWPNE